VITKVSGLLAEGLVWANQHLKLHDAIEAFKDEVHELIIKGKGIQLSSLGEPWG